MASGDAMDKAVAYVVQNTTFTTEVGIEGCCLNVVGFPLCLLVRLLRDAGIIVGPRLEWALHPKGLDCDRRDVLLSCSRVQLWCRKMGE